MRILPFLSFAVRLVLRLVALPRGEPRAMTRFFERDHLPDRAPVPAEPGRILI